MPFLGQDWRSPGEQWVRTSEGWERLQLWRLKLFENLNENVLARLLKLTEVEDLIRHKEMKANPSQPHILVTNRMSREKNFQISLSEALTRLDMCGAIKDIRRFNYVCKLLEFLVKHKFTSLSGAAQKAVLNLTEQLVNTVIKTNNNLNTAHRLLKELMLTLDRGYYDHVGGSLLWHKHQHMAECLQNKLNNLQLKERKDDGKIQMSDLPDDCIREILIRLNDHQDLVSTSLTEIRIFQLVQEKMFWRNLCLFHFTTEQWASVLKRDECLDTMPWSLLYRRLAKRYGLKDVFAEMLRLCKHCNTLFWEDHGHPCFLPDLEPKSISITPAMCVELFTG